MTAVERPFIVWCQGGPADDFRYVSLEEPESVMVLAPNPNQAGGWVRVLAVAGDDAEVDGSVRYVRVAGAEQFDHERIYYPEEPT